MKLATKLFNRGEPDWTAIAERLVRFQMLKQWSTQEPMLLLPSLKVPESHSLNGMLRVWFEMKKNLNIRKEGVEVHKELPVWSLEGIFRLQEVNTKVQLDKFWAEAKRLGVRAVGNLRRTSDDYFSLEEMWNDERFLGEEIEIQ
ncbi:hypothetical protein R1flu_015435 [Riccia fluitans]|uniref:Uncharacterized protein n=1 Tax=Riccia fluitans TaxID=41844 RepID=A0ABD1YJZ7_9MARC